ncbi:MAG TPA: phosphotransferase [Acidimicrobiales bacterium]|nr:phosphotransferase [Acidimicrobiales bacterium]
MNTLWRVRTAQGTFAVHRMRPRPGLAARCDAVLLVEQAAARAGVALAPPVPDPRSGRAAVVLDDGHAVVVHGWIGAEPVDVDRSPPVLYRRLGASIARIHGLGVELPPSSERSPSEADWHELARAAARRGLPWAAGLDAAAAELVDALDTVDRWDRSSGEPTVPGHRDLTAANVLDLAGTPVLIDWEDAGSVAAGTELGRTALDNVGRDGTLDPVLLRELVQGYGEVRPIPPLGEHWCSLWVRGLVVFAEHCARSCVEGTADAGLLRIQSLVVERTPMELRRRLAAAPAYVEAFGKASRSSS